MKKSGYWYIPGGFVMRFCLCSIAFFLCIDASDADGGEETPSVQEEDASHSGCVYQLMLSRIDAQGGLCVMIDSSPEVEYAAKLAESGAWSVHIITDRKEEAAEARDILHDKGLYGRITVEYHTNDRLSLADNLSGLILVNNSKQFDKPEIMRALSPGGRAFVANDESVDVLEKQSDRETGDWTHPWQDSTGNLASSNHKMGPLNSFQWIAGPPVPLGPRKGSDGVFLSAGGRTFQLTQNVVENFPGGGNDYLVARDAFNGALLWSRSWGRGVHGGPSAVNETIVAHEDYVYGALEGEILVLEAASGMTVARWNVRNRPDKLVLSDELLFVQTRNGIKAFEREKGTKKWNAELDNPSGLLVSEGRGFCLTASRETDGRWRHNLTALYTESGERAWIREIESEYGSHRTPLLRLHFATGGVVALLERKELRILCAENGRELWQRTSASESRATLDSRQVGHFYTDGYVWMRMDRAAAIDAPETWLTIEPKTGEVEREVELTGVLGDASPGCQRMTATGRFAIGGRESALWDLQTGLRSAWPFARGGCVIGVVPANGLAYIPPNACGCLPEQLRGTIALAHNAALPDQWKPGPLHTGPAYGKEINPADDDGAAWPTYRGNLQRGALYPGTLSANLDIAWDEEVSARAGKNVHDPEKTDLPELPEKWNLRLDPDERGIEEEWYGTESPCDEWTDIRVPAWYHQAGAGMYQGYAWYHVSFELPAGLDEAILINFGAVDEQAWVYVNGELVGENSVESTGRHPGELYVLAFTAIAGPDLIRPGERNHLVVRVHNHAGAGGIYQPVKLSRDTGFSEPDPGSEWKIGAGHRLSPPTAAGELVMVSEPQTHRVIALDKDSGAPRWSFTAEGRVTAPPTYYEGLALFGANDGYVYALRADCGTLIWRRRVAPSKRRIMVYSQLESAWPVMGGVFVKDGVAMAAAGRTAHSDGGAMVLGFDPFTGKMLWKNRIKDASHGKPDLLVSGGDSVYLMDQRIDAKSGEVSSVDFDVERVRGRGHIRMPEGVCYLRSGKMGFFNAAWTHMELALRKHQANWSRGDSVGEIMAFNEDITFSFQIDGVQWAAPHTRGGGIVEARQNGTEDAIWTLEINAPKQVEAMLLTENMLFIAGPKDRTKPEGEGFLRAIDTAEGSVKTKFDLRKAPVYDGMGAAYGRIFMTLKDGTVLCFDAE